MGNVRPNGATKAVLREIGKQLALIPSQQTNRPIWSDWSTANAIANGLKASEWVYTCVRKIASAVSTVPWFAEERVGENKWERNDAHPLSKLLARPNPYMSRQDLIERCAHHLYLGGNALWHLELVGGESNSKPINIMPLMPDQIKPIPSGQGLELLGYEYRVGNQKIPLKPIEVCHLMFADPGNPFWGLAPLRAAMQTVDTDVEAVRWNKVSLQNRAVSDGSFVFNYPLSDEQWEEARKQVREQHLGSEFAHMPWVLGAGAEWKPMSLSPVEMDFLKTRQFNVATICAVFGVPVVLVSQERTTYNNMQTGRRMFWQDTIVPFLDDLQDALDLRLTPFWNPESLRSTENKTLRINYDISGVPAMQEILLERVTTARTLFDMGVPFNPINQRLGLGFDAIEGGELPWGGRQPGITFAPTPETPKRIVAATEIKAGMAEQEKAAYYKAFDNDRARWEDRIARQIKSLFLSEAEIVADAYEEQGKAGIAGAIERNKTNWAAWLTEAYKQMVIHFGTLEGRRILRAIPKAAMLGEAETKSYESKERTWRFNFEDPAVEHFIRSESAIKVSAMSQTTRDAIAEAIAEGVSLNEGSADIAARIRAAYAEWAGEGDSALDSSRSFLIARTEAGAAVNFGHNEGARQIESETGAVVLKEWISARDSRVRDSHAAVDGEIRHMPDNFSNGLPYPNAPGAPIEEVANCRCVAAHLVEGLSA